MKVTVFLLLGLLALFGAFVFIVVSDEFTDAKRWARRKGLHFDLDTVDGHAALMQAFYDTKSPIREKSQGR